MTTPTRSRRLAGVTLALGGLAALALAAGPAGLRVAAAAEPHPAHIHQGSCVKLDPAPQYPLADVAMGGLSADAAGTGTPAAMPAAGSTSDLAGAQTAIPVQTSQTMVPASLQDLLASPHAINVHESATDIQTYIACGDLGGQVMTGGAAAEGGTLAVGLKQLNDSGVAGIAVLEGMGDQTRVSVYLAADLASGATGSGAAASPAADAAPAAQAVAIRNFAYDPPTIEIPVGATVTWTNDDTVPHTATAKDRSLLQSGTIKPGASYSQTFTTPGTFDYFCEFHSGMKGAVVVK